jgi:hypothetical protein
VADAGRVGTGVNQTESIKARLRADANCERIALFLCTTEGEQGQSGEAINERGELCGWWLFPDGHLDIRPYDAAEVAEINGYDWDDPEYRAARAEVGL